MIFCDFSDSFYCSQFFITFTIIATIVRIITISLSPVLCLLFLYLYPYSIPMISTIYYYYSYYSYLLLWCSAVLRLHRSSEEGMRRSVA